MTWVVAIALSLITGYLALKSLVFYYHVRYKFKTESRKNAAFVSDLVFMFCMFLLAAAPQIAIAKVATGGKLIESGLAVAIFWLFLLLGYFSVKKSNPHIIQSLFKSSNKSDQND